MLEPTNRLLELAVKYGVGLTFFVDAGFLVRLNEEKEKYPILHKDWKNITQQLKKIEASGCSVQLHVHPHWEKSYFNGEKWIINTTDSYKLADFPQEERVAILEKYIELLNGLLIHKVNSFRAGGWCVQPFDIFRDTFKKHRIVKESSVFPQGYFFSPHYAFDFRSVAPYSDAYNFEDDCCVNIPTGFFKEIPISSWKYTPLFYWRLYAMGRLNPKAHKMWGDGTFLAQPGRKKNMLTRWNWNHVSSDGFYAGKLNKQARFYAKNGNKHFVVIGHPKGLTNYAINKLSLFIANNQHRYQFEVL